MSDGDMDYTNETIIGTAMVLVENGGVSPINHIVSS